MTSGSSRSDISTRILSFINALPPLEGLRVLEIGCGPGVAAREISRRIGNGCILAIDRSEKAIEMAIAPSTNEIATGRLEFRCEKIEDFKLAAGAAPFDIAFAMRVGALDGRHPELAERALSQIRRALAPGGRLFVDTGDPVAEVDLSRST